MLRDEVPRTPVLLLFFGAIEAARSELATLGEIAPELAKQGVKIMAISHAKLDELKQVQRDMKLGFPLLHDDRNLSSAYGAGSTGEGEGPAPIAVLVGRDQRVLWIETAAISAESIGAAVAASSKISSTVNYPRRVINRLVDRWVN